jgi:hypothetical protein
MQKNRMGEQILRVQNLGDSWVLVSRALELVVQDLSKVVFLMSAIAMTWSVISLTLRMFGVVAEQPLDKAATKSKTGTCICEEAPILPCSCDEEEARKLTSAGFHLLEQYGIFGASPGAWAPQSSEVESTPDECQAQIVAVATSSSKAPALFEEDLSASALGPTQLKQSARTPRGMALLDDYGVFGVSPKCWISLSC